MLLKKASRGLVALFFYDLSVLGCIIDSIDKVKNLASDVCDRESCVLWDVQMTGSGKNRILRVSIDRKEGAVTVKDCENVSTALNLLLDAKDVVTGGAYFLEVSSPGIERSLKEAWQYQYAIGRHLDVTTADKVEVSKGDPFRFHGQLTAFEDDHLVLKLESDEIVKIPLDSVRKAKTVFKAPEASGNKAAKKPKKSARGS